MILNVFLKKSFFKIGMWHSRPPRDPPPHGKYHLKFPFWLLEPIPNELPCVNFWLLTFLQSNVMKILQKKLGSKRSFLREIGAHIFYTPMYEVAIAYSTNKNPSPEKLSRAINYSVGRMTKLMNSLSGSYDRIGGFPQQVGCWNCQ